MSLSGKAFQVTALPFDGGNAGLELDGGRAFSVQYHPEASPGPQDSLYLFERFVGMLGR